MAFSEHVTAFSIARKLNKEVRPGEAMAIRYYPQIYFYTKSFYRRKIFLRFWREATGATIEVDAGGRPLFSKVFDSGVKEEYHLAERVDFSRSLADPRTKYAIIPNLSDLENLIRLKQIADLGYLPSEPVGRRLPGL